ncbi:MAG TPA: hypothetical protein DCE42_14575 [Myxococcales bacterium]|nr:hypothetical protein [Deltaproteobacteria bacterium]MBU51256.1 hypothetical protein [Deltaproteobacteria bacterium]HAA55986.1 hypothetical protein [Myxococcales bacterium]|tara:strand:- start:1276 stop:1695 length:420 start_codon:yes stop_codon:yes gene_type:complete
MRFLFWLTFVVGTVSFGYYKYTSYQKYQRELERPYWGSYIYKDVLKIENLRKTKKIHMTLMPGMRAHIKIETIAMGIRGVEESKQDWSVDKGQLTIFSPFAGWLKCHKTKKGLRCKRSVDIFVFRKINKKAKLELLDDD